MPATPERRPHETILAFDFGLRRIGVAAGQTVTASANPVGVIANGPAGPDWQKLGELIHKWGAARLIVGMPLHVDGSRSEISARVDEFIAGLERFNLPVEAIDERYSSAEAEQMLIAERKLGARRRLRKEMIDAAAATLIAERWLRKER